MGNIFNQIFYEPISKLLVFLYDKIPGHDLGIAIIVITLLVRVILFPLAMKSIKSQMKMAKHKGAIKEIQNKFKTKEEQSRELMKFYKENKINPFSGCLPLIIQLPIIFALYRVLINVLKLGSSINPMFLGIINLSEKNVILAVLAGVSQFFASRLAAKRTVTMPQPGVSDKAAETQRKMTSQMTYFMPIITVVIGIGLPAGLTFYWVVSTLLGLAQDYYLYKKYAYGKDQKNN
jgi:YidC/Oxa1 family membrane protein insertase